jgi:hypothetical protein
MLGNWGITLEELPEFDTIFAVAITLGLRNKKKKAEKVFLKRIFTIMTYIIY